MKKRREDSMTNAMTGPANTTLVWSAILGLTAIVGSYGVACVFPFAALAALAAVTLPTRQAIALLGAAWAVNQIIGFTLLSYPHDAQAYTWGVIIGAAAFAALGASKLVFGAETQLLSLRSAAALVASIAAYQLVMFIGAAGLDGFESSTPEIVATVARNDALWFAGLGALRIALGMALPRWFGSAQTLRTA
jgi:hypothetical protein